MPIQRVCHLMIGQQAASPAGEAFIFTVVTTGEDETFTLPLEASGSYDFSVDWGDTSSDNISAWDDAVKAHTYSSAGTHEISITGTLTGFRFNNLGSKLKIYELKAWGILRLGNSNGYFYGCANLTVTATDILDLTGTTTLERMFMFCTSLTTVPSMNSWDVSNITNIDYLFHLASSSNQDISSWDTSSVTSMFSVFYSTAFNQDIGGWNVSSVLQMGSMFALASAFNADISSWNVSSVTGMRRMFKDAAIFNQDIGGWTVSSVNTMNRMFEGALLFNQNLNSWNVSGVLDMERMFHTAGIFNGNIGSWNVSSVTIFDQMFFNAFAFDQDLSGWDVTSVAEMYQMFYGCTLSTVNYSALLVGWESQAVLNNIYFHGGNSKYSAGTAATARAALIADHNWDITDSGQV